jgi:hypothetical protein
MISGSAGALMTIERPLLLEAALPPVAARVERSGERRARVEAA